MEIIDRTFEVLSLISQILGVMAWALGQCIAELYEASFDTGRYLKQEALITINAVGIAISLFALEQLLERETIARSDAQSRLLWRMLYPLRIAAASGFAHFASLGIVLIVRSSCDRLCGVTDVNVWLAGATNSTVLAILFLVAGVVWALVDLARDRNNGDSPRISY